MVEILLNYEIFLMNKKRDKPSQKTGEHKREKRNKLTPTQRQISLTDDILLHQMSNRR